MQYSRLLVIAGVVLGAAACTSSSQDQEPDDALVSVGAEEVATTGPTYASGTSLTTTDALNLRADASATARIILMMPANSRVTVREASGGNGWVAIRFGGNKEGWAHTNYLSDGTTQIASAVSTRAGRLASKAKRVDGKKSRGKCATEVGNSVQLSGILPRGVGWRRVEAASDVASYLTTNKAYANRIGFRTLKVSASSVPTGSVVGWRRGQCGYNRKYGHIEIAIGGGRACSDFCGRIKTSCGAPMVSTPT